MRLKSFYAKTMSDAMQMVRDTLGEDAVIVATREEKGGRAVRITAAVEPAFEISPGGSAAHADDWLQYDTEDEVSAVAEDITDAMLRHAVPEDVMDHIISCATVVGLEDPGIALIAAIEHLFNFRPLPVGPQSKPIIMVGPPGAGKTLSVAKLITRSVMNGLKVKVITADTVRAGGAEQLEAFTKVLRTPLSRAENSEQLRDAIGTAASYDQIIIDTPGINPFNMEDVRKLARFLQVADMQPVLVLPAGADAQECADMAKAFSALGINTFLPTRIDIARRLGGILSAAHYGCFAFADAGNTSKVADGFVPLTPQTLSKWLMPSAYRRKSTDSTATRKTGTH